MIITSQKKSATNRGRAGITLTEILIAILILGVGLVSLATLFPIGLLRLREAARYSRSSYLAESSTADLAARSLLLGASFTNVPWYVGPNFGLYNPLVQDTPFYQGDWAQNPSGTNAPGAYAGVGGLGVQANMHGGGMTTLTGINTSLPTINGPGLPVAYDPLWRYQTLNSAFPQANGTQLPNGNPIAQGGYYPFDNSAWEARFGSGIHFVRNDPDLAGTGTTTPSAHGLQRITNFNRPYSGTTAVMPVAFTIPDTFVSPEDIVWQEPTNQNYSVVPSSAGVLVGSAPSPVLPDLYINGSAPTQDWRFSWMFTGWLTNASNNAVLDGSIVVFENRPFGITSVTAPDGTAWYQVDGETIVEAIWGHSGSVNVNGYAVGADRTVLLRWNSSLPDPVVKVGDWIADVTYERVQSMVQARFWQGNLTPLGIANPTNNAEWDNLPAQRCYWYQVQKVSPATNDQWFNGYRSMVVYVNQNLISKTLLQSAGTPAIVNAALICPSVVNVIPRTIFIR